MKRKSSLICIWCQKGIERGTNYIQLNEWDEESIIKVNFVHKSCWEEKMDSKKKVGEAFGTLKGLKTRMQEMGILPEEEVTIK